MVLLIFVNSPYKYIRTTNYRLRSISQRELFQVQITSKIEKPTKSQIIIESTGVKLLTRALEKSICKGLPCRLYLYHISIGTARYGVPYRGQFQKYLSLRVVLTKDL